MDKQFTLNYRCTHCCNLIMTLPRQFLKITFPYYSRIPVLDFALRARELLLFAQWFLWPSDIKSLVACFRI